MLKKTVLALFVAAFCVMQLYAQLPRTYDLRKIKNADGDSLVSPVKSQTGGTCWCHGTMSGVEGNLLMTRNWKLSGETGIPNMAEYHLDWWNGFNDTLNMDLYPKTANDSGVELHNGGDYKIFCSYMSRLEGSIRESDAPGDGMGTSGAHTKRPDRFKASYHRWYVPDINWYYIDGGGAQGSLLHIDTIKYALQKYGVMPTNYLVTAASTMGKYLNLKTHYQAPTAAGDANHSVAIIGWDDSATTPAPKKGAWLCKNSWGYSTSTQDKQPFFWISYYDKHCCRNAEMSVVSFVNVERLKYDSVYYHDYHGWRDVLPSAKEAFNKYVAKKDQHLVAVSFFTTVDKEEWEVKIYDTYSGGALSGELASASGSHLHIGYHTVALNTSISIKKDNDFYMYLKVKSGGLAFDRSSTPPVLTETPIRRPVFVRSKANADESYYRTSPTGAWTDFYNFQFDSTRWNKSGNFCLKVFATDTLAVGIINGKPNTQKSNFFLRNYPNPFGFQTTIDYTLAENSMVSLAVYNANGAKVRTLADARLNAGEYKVVWNGKNESGIEAASGMYYAVLSVKTSTGVVTERRTLFLMK